MNEQGKLLALAWAQATVAVCRLNEAFVSVAPRTERARWLNEKDRAAERTREAIERLGELGKQP